MSIAIKISAELASEAKAHAKVFHRSCASQVEHWAYLGKIMEENPDLNYDLIKEILNSKKDLLLNAKEEYRFG